MKNTALALALISSTAALHPAWRTAAPIPSPDPVPVQAQEDGEQVGEEEEELGGLLGLMARRQKELATGLPGSWQLTDFRHVVNQTDDAPVFGYMNIEKGGFLTLVIHARDPQAGFFDGGLRVQGGVHHWRLTDQGLIQLSSILAHTSFSGELQVEPAYTLREYAPTLNGTFLTLRRSDNSELFFERIVQAPFPAEAARRIDAAREGRPIVPGGGF